MTEPDEILDFLNNSIKAGASKAYLTDREFSLVKKLYAFMGYFGWNTNETYQDTGCYGSYKTLELCHTEVKNDAS